MECGLLPNYFGRALVSFVYFRVWVIFIFLILFLLFCICNSIIRGTLACHGDGTRCYLYHSRIMNLWRNLRFCSL